MSVFRLLSILLLAVSPALAEPATATANLSHQQGLEALAARLPAVAVRRFQEALEDPELSPETRLEIQLRLGEAWLRDGHPDEALGLLEQPELAVLPEATFWRAQALAGMGRFDEAATLFASVQGSESVHATAARFSRASLLLALDRTVEAFGALEPIASAPDHPHRDEALLWQATIHFDLGQYDEARTLRERIGENPPPAVAVEAAFLDARLALEAGQAAEAAATFAELVNAENPEHQSLRLHHAAWLGLADATATADRRAAADSLLAFLERHPNSPLLGQAFSRLARWLPADLEANDPVLQRARLWANAGSPVAESPVLPGDGAASAFPDPANRRSDLAAHSLAFLAETLRPEDPAAANAAVRRLTLDFPDHPQTRQALLEQARWLAEQNRPADAAAILNGVAADPDSPATAVETQFLAARAEYLAGRYESAARRFEEAAAALDDERARAAVLDSAISRLRAGDFETVATLQDNLRDPALQTALELERALALAARQDSAAASQLTLFLQNHPDHPRAEEARLALAATALDASPPDLETAREQLEHPDLPPPTANGRATLLRLRLAELSQQWEEAIAIAREFLDQHPAAEEAPLISLKLGEALFRNKDYNAARLVLQTLASQHPESPLAEVALFHAARAAALGGTPQAQEESVGLFDQVAQIGGPLAGEAQVRKIRALLDLHRLEEAIAEARQLANQESLPEHLRVSAKMLLGEALFASGGSGYEEALEIYSELRQTPDLPPALVHRLHYLQGLALEELGREGEALDAYYGVLETRAPGEPREPEEWYQFERTAFRGLSLLESRKRWRAAVAFAEKIASFGGPRSREAAERAKKLRLDHMIWE